MQFEDYVLVEKVIPAIQLRNGDILRVGRNVVTEVKQSPSGVAYRVLQKQVRAQPGDPVRILVPELRPTSISPVDIHVI